MRVPRHLPRRDRAHAACGLPLDRLDDRLPARRHLPIFASSACTIAGGCVFVGSNHVRAYVLDLASGERIREYEAGSPVTSSPAVAKGKVVVAMADGQVNRFGQR